MESTADGTLGSDMPAPEPVVRSEVAALPPTGKRTLNMVGGFGAGVGAALFMMLVMALLRFISNTASIPELMEDQLILLTGGQTNSFFINSLGTGGKALLLVIILEGTLLLGGALGLLFAKLWPAQLAQRAGRWVSGLIYGALVGLFLNVVFLPLFGQGFFGSTALPVSAPSDISQTLYGTSDAPWGVPASINMFLLAFVFGLSLVRLLPWGERMPANSGLAGDGANTGRRGVLKILGGAALALVGGAGLWGLLGQALSAPKSAAVVANGDGGAGSNPAVSDVSKDDTGVARPTATAAPEGFAEVEPLLVPEITPTDAFYVTTKNYVDPTVNGEQWSLQFTGMVDNPYSLKLDEIKQMPSELRTHTLACISNGVGGSLISNGRWKGVSFAELLKRAKPQVGAVDIVVYGADGYTDSFPVSAGLNNNGLLAYEMNGAPLNQKHGYPLRLLLPAIYGMKNCKWITKVELVATDYKGYWQKQGWSDPAPYQTMSRIDYPDKSIIEAGPVYIGGVAFAGERGIKRVEVSSDGGTSWSDATIRPPLGRHTWVLWTYAWQAKEGNYTLKVRATDGRGAVQTSEVQDTYPDGATGYHTRKVRVSAAKGSSSLLTRQSAPNAPRNDVVVPPLNDKRAKGN